MMTRSDRTPTVLVVDDEEQFLELYAEWLRETYTVRTASSGAEALEQLDESVAVVLLDRRMPGMSGDETLEAIRDLDTNHRVAMVTAVEPEIEAIEMRFDDYIVKPTDREEVLGIVESMLALDEYDDLLQDYYRVVRKQATLETSVPSDDLDTSDRYQELNERLESIEDEIGELVESTETGDFFALLHRKDGSARGMENGE